MSNKLSKTIIRLLVANMTYRVATIIMKIFLNIFIIKLTGDLKIVALFSLFALTSHMLSYTMFSYILKYGYRNISNYIALFGTGILFLTLVVRPELIGEYYIIYGIVHGIFSGMYWCVYNHNQFDFTVPKNRGNYEGLKKSIRTIISIAVPVFIGAIITINPFEKGYEISFLLAACFCITSGIFGTVDETKLLKSKTKMKFLEYISLIKSHGDVWRILGINFLISFALSMPLIEVLFPLILHTDGFDEARIGFFVSITSGLSIIVSYLFGKYVSYKHYKKAFGFGAIAYIVTILGAVLGNSQFFIYAFIPFAIILYIIIDIPRSVFIMNVLHDVPDHEKYKGEHMLLQEVGIISGRSVVFMLLFSAGILTQETIHNIFILMGGAMFVAFILFMMTKHLDNT